VRVVVTYRVPVARLPFVGCGVGAERDGGGDAAFAGGPVPGAGGVSQRRPGEDGQALVLLVGLVGLVLMVLALGWDTSN
jgi:hypothetical protein